MGGWKTGLTTMRIATAFAALSLTLSVRAQNAGNRGNPASWRDMYFVAARPAGLDALRSHPAALYKVGEGHALQTVRQFFNAGGHFSDFANDLHGTIYLAGQSGIYVVHAGDPKDARFVAVPQFDDSYCWGAVYGGNTQPGVQYCPGRQVDLVPAQPNARTPRNAPGSWTAFKDLQFRGENGGPYQAGPPTAEVDGTDLVMPYGGKPGVVLAKLPRQAQASPQLRRRVSILASTDRYLVIWIEPPALSAATASTGATATSSQATAAIALQHAAPVSVLVLDKRTHHWSTLQLPAAVSSKTHVPVRLFGNWMVTTVMDWSPPAGGTGTASLSTRNEQRSPMYSTATDIHAAYDRRFANLQIPGKLELWNLSDGRRLTLHTGQEDSEVLSIGKDGSMLYRVNDAIYSAKIAADKIEEKQLVVKAPAVVDIHWALRGQKRTGSKGESQNAQKKEQG
jgi:hypothetical protein